MRGAKDSEEGKESLGGEKRISTEQITMFLLHGCYWGKRMKGRCLIPQAVLKYLRAALLGGTQRGKC